MSSPDARPLNWPSDITYLSTSSIPSPRLPHGLKARYCSAIEDRSSEFHPSRYKKVQVEIRKIDASTSYLPRFFASSSSLSTTPTQHPALGQRGLFALHGIPPYTFIRPYFGSVHTEDETDPHSEYDMKVDHIDVSGSIAIDATRCGNEARFVNDYRSIMARNNCQLDDWSLVDSVDGTERKGMGIFAGSKLIRAGTELTVNYGKGFWSRYARDEESEEGADQQGVGGGGDESMVSSRPSTSPTPTATNPTVQALLARQ